MTEALKIEPPQRDAAGRFLPGNKGGPGNPASSRSQHKMHVFRSAITDSDLRDLAVSLLEKAKKGDVRAATLLLEKVLPTSVESELSERLSEIETLMKTQRRSGK